MIIKKTADFGNLIIDLNLFASIKTIKFYGITVISCAGFEETPTCFFSLVPMTIGILLLLYHCIGGLAQLMPRQRNAEGIQKLKEQQGFLRAFLIVILCQKTIGLIKILDEIIFKNL